MKKFILLLLSFQCSLCHISLAQNPGDLDNNFNGGSVIMQHTPWMDVAVQPDGKVLAVSDKLVRFNINGTLDGSFGINGVDTIKINDTIYTCSAIGIQQDSKILVAGGACYYATLPNFLLIRYNTDGSPDSSFDGDGFLFTDLNQGSDDYGYELAIQPDGKIVVAGASNGILALCRYHSNGSLDSTFDNDGKLVVNGLSANVWSHVAYMKIQIDGKILVGCMDHLARLNSDGSLDNSFGVNGVVTFSEPMNDLAIQPDSKIVLGGGYSCFEIIRLDTNGNLDNSFGTGGTATTCWPWCSGCNTDQTATSIALQTDGKVLAGGYTMSGMLNDYRDFVLARYNPNGSIDSSFNYDGMVVTQFLGFQYETESHASVITPDQGIVLAGHSNYTADHGFIAKYRLGWIGWPLDANGISGNSENFVIAPNPTFDLINIDASKIENGAWHLELRDVTGRLMLYEDIVATGGSIQKKVSLANLPAGLYLLQLDNGKERTVSRVVKY